MAYNLIHCTVLFEFYLFIYYFIFSKAKPMGCYPRSPQMKGTIFSYLLPLLYACYIFNLGCHLFLTPPSPDTHTPRRRGLLGWSVAALFFQPVNKGCTAWQSLVWCSSAVTRPVGGLNFTPAGRLFWGGKGFDGGMLKRLR